MIGGIPVIIDPLICKSEFIRWRKRHRKARINKKWRKKYGAITGCKGVSYLVNPSMIEAPIWMPISEKWSGGKKIIMCPCVKAALEREATQALIGGTP